MASIHAGWFSSDMIEGKSYSKRLTALGHLYKKLMDVDLPESLRPIIIFAPPVQHAGHVKQGTPPTGFVFMYLAPTLEFDSQRDVDHIVAHEFAHVLLGHYANLQKSVVAGLPHEKQPHEVAADALAAEWGFPRRERGMTGFAKLLNNPASKADEEKRRACNPKRPRNSRASDRNAVADEGQ